MTVLRILILILIFNENYEVSFSHVAMCEIVQKLYLRDGYVKDEEKNVKNFFLLIFPKY